MLFDAATSRKEPTILHHQFHFFFQEMLSSIQAMAREGKYIILILMRVNVRLKGLVLIYLAKSSWPMKPFGTFFSNRDNGSYACSEMEGTIDKLRPFAHIDHP
jgi:hypothetical protein